MGASTTIPAATHSDRINEDEVILSIPFDVSGDVFFDAWSSFAAMRRAQLIARMIEVQLSVIHYRFRPEKDRQCA